jgi:gluconate 2-dehydrogenase gamma chain
MGGQGIERREALRFIGIASVAATFPGFSQWTFACSHSDHHQAAASTPKQPYTPLFFSPEQFRLIEHLAEMIIPADDTPGAKDAGVAEFIDFMVGNRVPVSARYEIRSTQDSIHQGEDAQQRFLAGINWMNARCKAEFGHEFLDCTAEQQKGLLEVLAYKAKYKPTTETGRQFFQMLRDYTVVGYYTTKIGLESLGYPGLRTAWPKMPGCTHLDDPEHVRLPKPAEVNTTALKIAR